MLKYAAAAASIGTGLAAGGYRYKKENPSQAFPWFTVSPIEQPLRIYNDIVKDLETKCPRAWPIYARAKEMEASAVSTLKPIADYQYDAHWMKSSRGSWQMDMWAALLTLFIFSGMSLVVKLMALLTSYVAIFLPKMHQMNVQIYIMFILYVGGVVMLLFFFLAMF